MREKMAVKEGRKEREAKPRLGGVITRYDLRYARKDLTVD
jgi:hypothetical protein